MPLIDEFLYALGFQADLRGGQAFDEQLQRIGDRGESTRGSLLKTITAANLLSSALEIGDALEALRSMQRSAIPVTISTQTATYNQCLILNVDVKYTRAGSAEFSLKCREIFITTTQTASGLKGKTAGRSASQSAKAVDKGTVQPEKVDLKANEKLNSQLESLGL